MINETHVNGAKTANLFVESERASIAINMGLIGEHGLMTSLYCK